MLDKIKTFLAGCFKSATMWFAVAIPAALSWVLSNFDTVSSLVLDPTLSDQVKTALHGDPQLVAWVLKVMATVAFISRARSIVKTAAK